MDAEFYRRLARRCQELRSRTIVESAREHLALMAAELEAQAEAIEHEYQPAGTRN